MKPGQIDSPFLRSLTSEAGYDIFIIELLRDLHKHEYSQIAETFLLKLGISYEIIKRFPPEILYGIGLTAESCQFNAEELPKNGNLSPAQAFFLTLHSIALQDAFEEGENQSLLDENQALKGCVAELEARVAELESLSQS